MVHAALTQDIVRPGPKQVFAFVDTNVLLHFRFFGDVDWAAEFGAEKATLVFAPVVVEELDEQKWAGTRRTRTRAKKVLRALKGLGLSATPQTLRSGVTILALDEEPTDDLFVRHRLQPRIADDRLLASVLAFAKTQPRGVAIKVLTADMGLSLKAPTRHIAVIAPDDRLRRDDEPDETERELETARRDLAALRAAAPKLKLTNAGKDVLECQVRRFGEFGSEKLASLLDAWRSNHPYVGATPDSIVMPGGTRVPLGGLAALPGYRSKEEAVRHNKAVDRIFGEYKAFLRRWPACVNAVARCIEFQFVLENAGTAPADDIDILVSARANGKWLTELPDLPPLPSMPKARNPFDLHHMLPPPHLDLGHLSVREEPNCGPIILEEEPATIRYTVKRVMHHVPCDLPQVFFQFDSDKTIQSFSLEYRIVAANIPNPKSNDLHVKLAVARAMEPPTPQTLLSRRKADR